MDAHQKVLFVDAATGYYRVSRFAVGEFFGPVDLGLHLAGKHNSLNIGAGLLAGSNRTVDYAYSALRRQHEVDGRTDTEPLDWIDRLEKDKTDAALT